jgi:hypothetical protein
VDRQGDRAVGGEVRERLIQVAALAAECLDRRHTAGAANPSASNDWE